MNWVCVQCAASFPNIQSAAAHATGVHFVQRVDVARSTKVRK